MNDHWNEEQVRHALVRIGYQEVLQNDIIKQLKGIPESREVRTLRYRLKQANRELGKAGHRIYELRCQLAEVRSMSGVDRGAYRGLAQQLRELRQQHAHADVSV